MNDKLVYISPPDADSLSGHNKTIKEIDNQWTILNFLTDNKASYNDLLLQNQLESVWKKVQIRKLKLIRDRIDLNLSISDNLFLQLTENKIEFIIYKVLNSIGLNILKLYIKLKIRILNSCVDYSVI